jgi:hypothetical protein
LAQKSGAAKMKVRKAMVIIGVSNEIHSMDVIEYQKKFWLVPYWLDNPIEKVTKPLRIVSLETLRHSRADGRDPEFVVEFPVPSYVFEGRTPPAEADKYVVIENPDVLIPRDPTKN